MISPTRKPSISATPQRLIPMRMPSKMMGSPMVRRERPLQSGPSQGYLIANAQQTRYPPGGPNHVVGLSAHPCVAVSAGTRTLLSSPAPADLSWLLVLHLPTDPPWSAFRLQRALAWEVIQAQCERSARRMARKWVQMRE